MGRKSEVGGQRSEVGGREAVGGELGADWDGCTGGRTENSIIETGSFVRYESGAVGW